MRHISIAIYLDFAFWIFAVHQTKKLIGTFNPRQEQYTFELEEGTTPSGFFARGPFLVRSKVNLHIIITDFSYLIYSQPLTFKCFKHNVSTAISCTCF